MIRKIVGTGGRSIVIGMIVGIALLARPGESWAQHGGGGGGRGLIGTGTGVSTGPPSGISEKDDLKDFHRALALQATDEQRAAFAKVVQYTQTASDNLTAFREDLSTSPSPNSAPLSRAALPERAAAVNQLITRARSGNVNFLNSLSSAQKSGLKDVTSKIEKAESEVEKQVKALDQMVQSPQAENPQLVGAADNLSKELANFYGEQLRLACEMGILLSADGQELTFNLPRITNSINVAGQAVAVPVSEVAARTSVENGRDTFKLKLVADLSDLQLSVTRLMRAALTRTPDCGERVEIQKATFTPLEPASLLVAQLHFERWVCSPGQFGMEVASGGATIEVKLTASVEAQASDSSADISSSGKSSSGITAPSLRLTPEITRVEADGFLRDALRSGDLGITLRNRIASVLLYALTKTTNLKDALPVVAKDSAVLQEAQFQDAGADQMNLILTGRLEMSDEQAQQFASQLKQALAAKGAPAP